MFGSLKGTWRDYFWSDEKFRQRADAVVPKCPVPTFWMLGKTGSGKTSIVRYLTGANDAEIGSGFRPQTRHSRRYDFPSPESPVLRLIDTRGLGEQDYDPEPDIATFDPLADLVLITARLKDQALGDLVQMARRLRANHPERPVLLVVTCLHEAYPQQPHPIPDPFGESIDGDAAVSKMPAEARRLLIEHRSRFGDAIDRMVAIDLTLPEDGFADPDYGGQRLKDALVDLLPDAYRQSLLALENAHSPLRAERASPTILGYSLLAATAAAAPIPWIDISFVMAIQTRLIYRLAKLYEVDLNLTQWSTLAAPLGGRMVLRMLLSEPLKIVPVVGIAANSALSYAYTYGLGRACCWYFDQIRGGRTPSRQELEQIWQRELQAARKHWTAAHESRSGADT